MGKRPTNKTKSGKFMNPTDQARKEARKKELKKNKKQRALVRTAVLKGKNPREIIQELEKIDDMEYSLLSPSPLNAKVLGEKRSKLVTTWNRVIRLYEKEQREMYIEFKRLWQCYLVRKQEVMNAFEAVKNAENVVLEDIPLPSSDLRSSETFSSHRTSSILKKPYSVLDSFKPRKCPGVPSVAPPKLSTYEDDESDDLESIRTRKIRFENVEGDVEVPGEESSVPLRQNPSQDVDQYMKEMEEVHRQTIKSQDSSYRLPHQTPSLTPRLPPPPMFIRPGPPPLVPGVPPPNVRPPPGLPPGASPIRLPQRLRLKPKSVLTAEPQLNNKSFSGPPGIIEAKPQMRNLRSDITRFIPTNLRVKRQDTKNNNNNRQRDPLRQKDVFSKHIKPLVTQHSKDDAYAQFMSEMDSLLK